MSLRPPRALRSAAALLAVAALLLAAASPAEAAKRRKRKTSKKRPAPIPEVARPPDPFEVTFPSPDGVTLVATWKPAATGGAPAVLLLHAFSRERREMAGLADELGSRGFSTLALDLRGHGESVRKGGARFSASPSLQNSPQGFPRDVEAACAWLRKRAGRVGVLGVSLSGNLAALATASGWAEAGVAVSANAERLASLAGTRPASPRGLLVLAAEKDPGRAASARALDAAGREPKSVVLYPGAAHALALLRAEPAAKAAAFAWLETRLGPVAPPPTPTPAPVATASAPPAPTVVLPLATPAPDVP